MVDALSKRAEKLHFFKLGFSASGSILPSSVNGHEARSIHDDKKKRWTLKSNVMIRFADTTEEKLGEDVRDRAFDEEWATKHPDPKARRVVYTMYYGASFVRAVDLVAVDGYRAMLPMPKAHDVLVVDPWEYRFARIVNGAAVDEYMGRAGLTVRG